MKEFVGEIAINDGDLMHCITETLANRKYSDGTPMYDITIYPPKPGYDPKRGIEVIGDFRIMIYKNVKI